MDRRNVDILLVRMDKLGDLVLSLPADEHPVCSGRRVHWFISKGLGFIPEQAVPRRQATEFKRRFSPVEFSRLLRWLRKNRPRTVVLLHNPWWVSLAMWLAGVPERIGRRSQWHSFLFVNVPVRQKRSMADRHESDFNFDLVEFGFNHLGARRTSLLAGLKKTYLRLRPPNPLATVASRGLKARAYRVVHPGMAGSALNWPGGNFVELIERFAREYPVVITGTASDRKYLREVEGVREIPGVRWLVDELRPMELLDILSQARSVVAPSTGVLHLAASLGTPAIGIYSPLRVQHPRRWGPKGQNATYLVPPAQEADMFAPDIMKQITPEQVHRTALEMERPSRDSDAQSAL
jgi:ADP-heptose:LPS heptosyltransferase